MKEKQLTKEEAIRIHDSGEWKSWNAEEIVKFQLFQRRLCMPFDIFHKAVEEVLGRPVWTHEFASLENLKEEYLKEKPRPTLEEICELVPKEKLIVVAI